MQVRSVLKNLDFAFPCDERPQDSRENRNELRGSVSQPDGSMSFSTDYAHDIRFCSTAVARTASGQSHAPNPTSQVTRPEPPQCVHWPKGLNSLPEYPNTWIETLSPRKRVIRLTPETNDACAYYIRKCLENDGYQITCITSTKQVFIGNKGTKRLESETGSAAHVFLFWGLACFL